MDKKDKEFIKWVIIFSLIIGGCAVLSNFLLQLKLKNSAILSLYGNCLTITMVLACAGYVVFSLCLKQYEQN
jgi:hypothetical protein